MDDRLWDDVGREWSRIESDLSRAAVESLVSDVTVRMGVRDDFGQPLRWVDDRDRERLWADVAKNFADGGVTSENAPKRGPMPFVASVWASRSDRLILFEAD
jgi:hypothetical protein